MTEWENPDTALYLRGRAERDAEIRAWCEAHNTEGWVDWLDMLDSLGGDTDG